ncbi:MAG: hypothetical protein OXI16_09075 [Chloroflexota bacterium]|nr:hypothetical protein [Chloroflexota bacterium]
MRAVLRAVNLEDARISRIENCAWKNKRYLKNLGVKFTEEVVERAIDEAFESDDISAAVEAAFEDMQESAAAAWVDTLNGVLHGDYNRNTCRALIRSGQWDEIASEHETRCEHALRKVLELTAEYWSGEYDPHN